jgi:glycosyltransferase involved in cell wall biosynthesis
MIETPISSENPAISVVIPTIPANDHKDVTRQLEKQEFSRPYEVIVVNDESKDICEARNTGIREASAEIVSLTDDDCEPPLNWLSSIIEVFDTTDLVCVEGQVTGGINYTGARHYVGCNISFKRDAALEIGGFDSRFAGWRDDTEFGWRMEEMGRCKYSESVLMRHPPRPGSSYIHDNELKLKKEFPEKYIDVMVREASLIERTYRSLHRIGFVDLLNKLRYER